MKPSTVRTGCAFVTVAAITLSVAMAAFGVRDFTAYLGTSGILIMAVFVAMTSPRCRS